MDNKAIELADQWDGHTTCDGDYQKIGDAMAAELRRLSDENKELHEHVLGYTDEAGNHWQAIDGKAYHDLCQERDELAEKLVKVTAPAADEREAFEKWCSKTIYNRPEFSTQRGGYVSPYVWLAWQARAALQPEQQEISQACQFGGCVHKAHGEPAFLAGVNPFAQPAAVPEGWQLVPKEPTPEMIDAWNSSYGCWEECYAAMLAAAPQPKENGQ